MLRGALRGTGVRSKFGRTFCNNAEEVTANGNGESKLNETPQRARLWAMQRPKNKFERAASVKAWRIPACIDFMVDWLPEGVGSLLYMDRLQVHQYYWKLGNLGFICTPFQLDIYEQAWDWKFEKASVLTSVLLYPHLMNYKEEEIINLTLVSPKHWGKRCLLHYSGEQDCIGLKKGGIIKKGLTYIALDCEVDLPLSGINVDVSNLDIGEEILIGDLNLEFKIKSNLSLKTPVCKVLPAGKVLEEQSPLCSENYEDSSL